MKTLTNIHFTTEVHRVFHRVTQGFTQFNPVPNRCGGPLCATLWLMIIAISTQAQIKTPPSGVRGAAIVIGISQYKEVTPLQFADRDATAFAEFLKTQQVPEDNIKLFLNENATRFNIVDELYNLSQQLKKGDKFFFYFGGHGDLEAKIGYENSLLLLYNSFKKSYFQGNEYLQLSELKTWFGALTQKGVEVIFIADACHSGGLIGGKEGNTKTQKALQESWEGITKILSSKADEYSLEGKQWGGGRGIFSYHLVNGLTGRADANKDQKVSLTELSNYLTTNVVREANPNIQTPVILGKSAQFLSKVSKEGLAKLADYEKRNFPIITEVNLKGGEERDNLLISKLDTTLVYTYKQFTKALKDKRLNTFDDSTDYALLHYRKLIARKIPDNLVQRMKRNLGAALMEREVVVMNDMRENGRGNEFVHVKKLYPAIDNIEEVMNLLGKDNYLYPYLQSRKLILETLEQKRPTKEWFQQRCNNVFEAVRLEPSMVSSYTLLSTIYRSKNMPDSAIYFQEKVVQLLPNQGFPYLLLGVSYDAIKYTDEQNKAVVHPKVIEYIKKAIEVEPTLWDAYNTLGNFYLYPKSGEQSSKEDKKKALEYFEKVTPLIEKKLTIEYENPQNELLKKGLSRKSPESIDLYNATSAFFLQLIKFYVKVYSLHHKMGNGAKAEEYLSKLLHNSFESAWYYSNAASEMCSYQVSENSDVYLKNALNLLELESKSLNEHTSNNKELTKNYYSTAFAYRNNLIGQGAVHRALKNDEIAEGFYQKALAYTMPPIPPNVTLQWNGQYMKLQNRYFAAYLGHFTTLNIYGYRVDVNIEMAFLKLYQNKPEEALIWIEKAFQNPASQHEIFFKKTFIKAENLNKEAYQALLDKYFPPTSNEKK